MWTFYLLAPVIGGWAFMEYYVNPRAEENFQKMKADYEEKYKLLYAKGEGPFDYNQERSDTKIRELFEAVKEQRNKGKDSWSEM